MKDQRWLVLDPRPCPLLRDELREQMVRRGPGLLRLDPFCNPFADHGHDSRIARSIFIPLQIDLVVPDVERPHRGVIADPLAVFANDIHRDACRVAVGKLQMMGRDHHARRQPLQIPLERRRQRLVEIVDVEDHVALRRREPAEIHQVRVAARLHLDPARRRRGKIGGDQRGGTPVERERRCRHAPVADREQVRHPAFIARKREFDRVAPTPGRLPSAMRRARRGVAQRPPLGSALVGRCVVVFRSPRANHALSFGGLGHDYSSGTARRLLLLAALDVADDTAGNGTDRGAGPATAA